MPLTPADVHNVAFKKPPIGKRGYDEEEVDAFLDEVERELARLIEENNELRAQAARGGGGAVAGDPRLGAEVADLKTQLDRAQREKAAAEQAARQMQVELEQSRASGGARCRWSWSRAVPPAAPAVAPATASSRPCGY
jgi:DivIVA domain-containing protein